MNKVPAVKSHLRSILSNVPEELPENAPPRKVVHDQKCASIPDLRPLQSTHLTGCLIPCRHHPRPLLPVDVALQHLSKRALPAVIPHPTVDSPDDL